MTQASAIAPSPGTPCRVVIVVKAPEPGKAKTRLIPALGAGGAAALAERMMYQAVATACAATPCVELYMTPPANSPVWSAFSLPTQLARSDQPEGDLGQRMSMVAERAIQSGEQVILIGTDCPALTTEHLREVKAALQQYDAVVIPALDGGYVLLGLGRYSSFLFEGIAWSTAQVCRETVQKLLSLQWSFLVMSPLPDIDEPDSLAMLPAGFKHESK